ncbi:hypothetical protein GJAV_G00225560, partial [Gymnothorax javanicus]
VISLLRTFEAGHNSTLYWRLNPFLQTLYFFYFCKLPMFEAYKWFTSCTKPCVFTLVKSLLIIVFDRIASILAGALYFASSCEDAPPRPYPHDFGVGGVLSESSHDVSALGVGDLHVTGGALVKQHEGLLELCKRNAMQTPNHGNLKTMQDLVSPILTT